jgi:iron complex transport system ATP-binding protein
MSEIPLEIKQIRHVYSETGWELHLPDIKIQSGEILGIIGPNGSGKSTLMRIGAGILLPNHGYVTLNAKDLRTLNRVDIARILGYLPQELNSLYDLTVEELVSMGRYPHAQTFSPWSGSDRRAVERSLLFTELDEKKGIHLSHLSGGERKRTFLASILAQEPQVMLLDEPTSSLDVHYQIQFFSLLKELSSNGMAVAVATHDLNLASLFSDTLLILDDGKAAASGSPREVLSTELVQAVYGESILMGQHPEIDRPTFLPRINRKKKS